MGMAWEPPICSAAYFRTYQIFLLGLFLLGVGLAILQSAANPYVPIVGPLRVPRSE